MPESNAEYHIYQPNTVAVDLFRPLGVELDPSTGLYVAPHDTRPITMGRVTARHATVTDVAVGDVIIFTPYAYDEAVTPEETFYIMHTDNIIAVIEGYDAF